MEISKDIILSAENISAIMTEMFQRILCESYNCHTMITKGDYWSVILNDHRLTICEIARLMDAIHASHEARIAAFPEDDYSIADIGMEASDELLRAYLGITWAETVILDNALLLVHPGEPERVMEETSMLHFGSTVVEPSKLKSSDELREYMRENGCTYDVLEDFCKDYYDTYHNSLFWHYPINDDVHTGVYIVLCSDGILSLPYDNIDCDDGYEYFVLDDAHLFDKEAMASFIDEYANFSKDLLGAMSTTMLWLK